LQDDSLQDKIEYQDNLQELELQFSSAYTRATKEKRKKLTSRSFQGSTSWCRVPRL